MPIATQGTTIEITKTGTPPTVAAIAQATGWSGPRMTRNEIDVTNLLSTAKEFLLGLKDPGEFSIDVNYDLADPGQKLAWDELGKNENLDVKVTFPLVAPATTPGSFAFQALVMNFETAGRADDKVTGTLTLRITGDVTAVAPV
jgi:hypothetical protein